MHTIPIRKGKMWNTYMYVYLNLCVYVCVHNAEKALQVYYLFIIYYYYLFIIFDCITFLI